MKTITPFIVSVLSFLSINTTAQNKSFDTDLPYVYLHQVLGNETDTSACTITPLSLPAYHPYNVVCNVKELTETASKDSYVNLFFANKKDTLLYNIHHSANLKIPPGTYTLFIQRKGMGYVNKEIKIKEGQSFTVDLMLKPRPVVMDVKYACATKHDIKKLIKALEHNPTTVEEQCNCLSSGVVYYD